MNGKGPKNKGDRFERDIVLWAAEHGLEARRLRNEPGLGDVDICIDAPDWDVYVQAKRGNRATMKAAVEQAIKGCPEDGIPVVCIKRDREPPLFVVPFDVFWELIGGRKQ